MLLENKVAVNYGDTVAAFAASDQAPHDHLHRNQYFLRRHRRLGN
jgi:hypothetical protein